MINTCVTVTGPKTWTAYTPCASLSNSGGAKNYNYCEKSYSLEKKIVAISGRRTPARREKILGALFLRQRLGRRIHRVHLCRIAEGRKITITPKKAIRDLSICVASLSRKRSGEERRGEGKK
jgi:hypothetical protein